MFTHNLVRLYIHEKDAVNGVMKQDKQSKIKRNTIINAQNQSIGVIDAVGHHVYNISGLICYEGCVNMIVRERWDSILSLIQERNTISVTDLSRILFASEATIRRDLTAMEREGLVKRVHGGVTRNLVSKDSLIPYSIRASEMVESRKIISQKAAVMVHENDVIMMDASSTSEQIAQYLPNDKHLTVITTGLKTAMVLAERRIDLIITGGIVPENDFSMIGGYTETVLRDMHADICFSTCRGVSLDGRMSTANLIASPLFRLMLKQSRRFVLCLSSEKIGREYFYTHGTIEDVDEVLCDKPLPDDWPERIGKNRPGHGE